MVFHRRLGLAVLLASGCAPEDYAPYKQDGSLDLGIKDTHTTKDLGSDAETPFDPDPYTCDPNTLALFHFDDPSPLEDACNNITAVDVNTQSIPGRLDDFGQARRLTGTDPSYLNIPGASFSVGSGDLTVELLVRLQSNLPAGVYTLAGKASSGSPNPAPNNGFDIKYQTNPRRLYCDFYDAANGATTAGHDINLEDNQWRHVRCERRTDSATTIRLSVDGQEKVLYESAPNNDVNNPSSLFVGNSEHGRSRGDPDAPLDIDELRISTVARSF